jgi:putative Holliday junction resolvase
MRYLGVDVGRRRVGLALSDELGMLSRPWRTVEAGGSPRRTAEAVAALLAAESADDSISALAGVVVGLPRRLNGEDTHGTRPAREFAAAVGDLLHVPVYLQDERLSSREAESRLARTERDWRRRKAQLDAVSAAIILQDFLDGRAVDTAGEPPAC